MMNFLAEIFGTLIRWIYNLVGQNYGLSIVLFTIITKLILFPITYKQTKSMEDMKKISGLEKEIREKYKGNKEKTAEEIMKLYSEHKVNPMGGCLPLLIQIPIILAMFWIVRQPLTYILQTPKEELQNYTMEYLQKESLEEVSDNEIKSYEIQIASKYNLIDMKFLGIDFGQIPSRAIRHAENEEKASYLTLLVPILSFVFSFLQIKLNEKTSNMTDEQKEQQKMMNIMMPILSAYISFVMPLALGIYWLLGNVLQMLTQYIISKMIQGKKEKILLEAGGN